MIKLNEGVNQPIEVTFFRSRYRRHTNFDINIIQNYFGMENNRVIR